MIVLHAVAESSDGLGGAAQRAGLRRYDARGLAVLHREQADPPPPDAQAVLAFGQALRELADDVAGELTVLPMRYGSVVPDREALHDLVEEHHEEWHALLHALQGRVELIVHLPEPDVPSAPPGDSGRDYLEARAAAVHAQEAQLEQLRGLDGVEDVRALRRRRVSLLVATSAADQVRQRLAALGPAGATPVVTGPWPPFSFCEGGLS